MRWLAALIVLAGCAAEPVVERPSFRDRTVPIASQVDVTFAGVEGTWLVRGSLPGFPVRSEVGFRVRDGGPVFSVSPEVNCPADPLCATNFSRWSIESVGPGRWRLLPTQEDFSRLGLQSGSGELWVLWADADRRTLAIGTPDGSFGFILDRNETGGDDRIAAARDIMAWMGYRVDEMVTR